MTARLDMAELQNEINEFLSQQVPELSQKCLRKMGLDLLRGCVMKSPVQTGRFRGNWQASANAPNPTAVATVDKRARGTPPGAEVWTRAMAALKQARPFGICYVQNNLPYARRIETGWSQQSPMGVLALTLAELRSEIYEPEELANV